MCVVERRCEGGEDAEAVGAGSRVSLHDYLLDVDAVVATVEVCMCQSVARLSVCVCF